MIVRTVFRMLWVAVAFCIAVAVALAVLFALGALWVGDELRAAAYHDPMLRAGGAPFLGIALFASTVTPALTALPAPCRGSSPARGCCVSAPGCITCLPAGHHWPPSLCWPGYPPSTCRRSPPANT